jgi:hypothetical protein
MKASTSIFFIYKKIRTEIYNIHIFLALLLFFFWTLTSLMFSRCPLISVIDPHNSSQFTNPSWGATVLCHLFIVGLCARGFPQTSLARSGVGVPAKGSKWGQGWGGGELLPPLLQLAPPPQPQSLLCFPGFLASMLIFPVSTEVICGIFDCLYLVMQRPATQWPLTIWI